jgi:hypothetical protein
MFKRTTANPPASLPTIPELSTQNFDLREIWAFFQGVFNFFKGGL